MEDKRKIMYFLDFPYGEGGSSRVLLTQAYIMRLRGYKVTVVIPNNEKGEHTALYDELCNDYDLNIITAVYPISTSVESIDIIEVLECYDKVHQLLTKEQPDFIHSVQINIVVELAARECKIPHLMNIYQTDEEAFSIRWMDIFPKYHSADSKLFSERWRNGLGIPSRCIRVAYRGSHEKMIHATDDDTKSIHLLSIGIVSEVKNQMGILRFVQLCKNEGIRVILTILGNDEGSYGKRCREYVERNGLEEEVIFQGFVHNVEDYFTQADLMILASVVESYPGVIVESMANLVPVLSTPVAGVPELLQDGYNGFLTEGYDSKDIYKAFVRYLEYRKSGEIQTIINHAYDTYLQNHSYEAAGSQLEDYYDWICQNYRKDHSLTCVENVKMLFEDFLSKQCPKDISPYTRKNLWFLYHLREVMVYSAFQRIVIWGAGFFGETALEWLEIMGCRDRLTGYVDTYKTGEYMGYPILEDKEQVVKNSDMVLLAIGNIDNCLEVMKYLEQCGKKRNKNYFLMLNHPIRI